MAAMKPRTGDGPLEVTKEGRGIVMRVPLEGGGRLVVELTPDADHGFLLTKEGGLLYFHRNAVLIGDFDRLDRGDEVYYVEDLGDTGPIATKVRVKAEG